MKKVVAFMGSPRKNGNTSTIIGEIIRGAKEVGAETKVYNLYDMNIKPCTSCFTCRKEDTCAINDDMQLAYQDMKDADSIIIGSPMYLAQINGQTKLFMDRLFVLKAPDVNTHTDGFSEWFHNKEVKQNSRLQFPTRFGEKKAVIVYSQGNPDPDFFKIPCMYNEKILNIIGFDVIDTIRSIGANDPKTACNDVNLMKKAFEAGKSLGL